MTVKKDTCSAFIDALCERFKNRGIAEKIHADEEASRKKAGRAKRKYSSEDVSRRAKRYRSGTHNGRAYMTEDDFAAYYKALRDAKLPEGKPRSEQEYEDAIQNAQNPTPLQTKKERRLAITKLLKTKAGNWGLLPPNPKKFIEETNKDFEQDTPDRRGVARQRKIPKKILLVVCTLFISMLLIVTSSVMVSRMEGDVARLESRLEALEAQKTKLEGELTQKNNMVEISEMAENEYNMIKSGYQQSRYISVDRTDKIEMSDDKSSHSAFIRLMEALGIKAED